MTETWTMLKQGGLLMIPLGVFSLLGAAIVIERLLALRKRHVLDPEVVKLVETYDEETSPERALHICSRARGAYARIVEQVIRARNLDHPQVLETMHATGRNQVGALERGLTVLEIIAGISPLVGLLGTVVGLLNVFEVIMFRGLGNAQYLSGGIAKALITTVAGLSVGIPALACHIWLSRRVEDFATDMQDRVTSFITRLVDYERRRD